MILACMSCTEGQQLRKCIMPGYGETQLETYRSLTLSALQSRLAGERIAQISDQELTRKLSEDQIEQLNKLLMFVDLNHIQNAQVRKVLTEGVVPSQAMEKLGPDWLVEQYILNQLYSFKGPIQVLFDLLQSDPALKYQPERVKVELVKHLQQYGIGMSDANQPKQPYKDILSDSDTSKDSAMVQCLADYNYLYGAFTEMLNCAVKEVVNAVIREIFGNCTIVYDPPFIGPIVIDLCLEVISPSRALPKVSMKCEY